VVAKLDGILEAKWQEDKVTPAPAADDATFLRRVYLDLTGQVPPVEKVQTFLADRKADKRVRLVDELLASDAFAEHWARTWAIRLTDRRPTQQDTHDGRVLKEYLRDSIKANKPYPRVVRDLVSGDGLADGSGPTNFLLRYNADPIQLAGAVGKQFMGATLQCAQCHDHVFAKWKKSDFWGMAAVFGRLKKVNSEDGTIAGILEARRGELEQPDPKGKPDENGNVPMIVVKPKLPGASEAIKGKQRRNALADWLTSDDNPYVARHYVNQTWKQLFGSKLVPGLDDVDGVASQPHGDILELLTADFKSGGYDTKRLVRVLVLSRAYQLGSKGGQGSADEVKLAHRQLENFARFRARPLSVDQLYASVIGATGYNPMPDPPPPETPPATPPEPPEDPEEDPADKPVEALGPNSLTVQRALVLLNGDFVHQAASAGAAQAAKKKGEKIDAGHIEYLFLATLSRKPDADEGKAMLKLLEVEDKNAGLQDVIWALLNSAEFNSNH